jgi:glutamine---fructose-6-phosphate transaminase (isomerizing)
MTSNIYRSQSKNRNCNSCNCKGDKEKAGIVDETIEVPGTNNALVPLLSAILFQLFAYQDSLSLRFNVDLPGNLAKSMRVE